MQNPGVSASSAPISDDVNENVSPTDLWAGLSTSISSHGK